MKKSLLFFASLCLTTFSFAQNTLEVTDTGNITRERWRDSVLLMDKSQVPTGFLLEYSMFGFESQRYDGVNNNMDSIKTDGQIFELHNILWHSKVNENAAIGLTDTIFSKAFFASSTTNGIPFT